MIFIPEIPNNSLKSRIEEIVYLAKAAVNSEYYEEELLTFEFNQPASEDEINELEAALGVGLDEGYKDLLRFSNGAVLCFNAAEFYNTDTVISLAAQEKEDSFPKDYIMIADVIGDGEVLCYSADKKKYVSLFEGEEEEYDSFTDFLDEVIDRSRDTLEEYIDL